MTLLHIFSLGNQKHFFGKIICIRLTLADAYVDDIFIFFY